MDVHSLGPRLFQEIRPTQSLAITNLIRKRWPGLLVALSLTFVNSRPVPGAEHGPINLLFLMTDQHHAAAMGCAGSSVVKTPNLDRLAAGGTRFVNSFCVVPYCSPTRMALVTGRYPSSFGLGRNIDQPDDPLRLREPCETYLHRLVDRGYHCHQLGKWHLGDPRELNCFPNAPNDDESLRRLAKQRRTEAGNSRFDSGPRPGETERIGDVWLREEAAEAHRRWLPEKSPTGQDVGVIGRSKLRPEFHTEAILAEHCIELMKRHRNEPFALVYSVSPPHAPCVAPAPFYDMYDPARLVLPATWSQHRDDWSKTLSGRLAETYGEEGVREWVRCYYAQVSMMDWCFGRILNALDELGLADRTLVVFTSDHGTLLGQHGMIDKAVEAFYDDLMRVPLIMRLPGKIPAGKTCPARATSVDVAPTILDYLAVSPLTNGHGHSLQPLLEGKADDDRPVFGERGRLDRPHAARMIRTRRWKLNLLARGQVELYDLQQDPDELHNLAHDPVQASRIRELSSQLFEHMRAVGDQGLSQFTK